MTTPTTISIDGTEYIRADSFIPTDSPVKILVLKDRWNLVGHLTDMDDDGAITLTDAKVIRYWGTTAGLGQIAKNGPTNKTILDPCNGTVVVEAAAVLFTIDCDPDKW